MFAMIAFLALVVSWFVLPATPRAAVYEAPAQPKPETLAPAA
ncbi:MAG TPA: hypothetical protein VGC96_03000 [Candidatus Elarobacter sp.]